MTQGFYEQLGARPDADVDEVKAAYGRAVAHLLRRREATLGQGGDTASLDLARAQLDEAWDVLSDPARRRRYDAMLAVAGHGLNNPNEDDLWGRVAGAMIHPSVAAAARLVDECTNLALAPLPEPPRIAVPRRVVGSWGDEEPAAPALGPGSFGAPRPVTRTDAGVVARPPATATAAVPSPARPPEAQSQGDAAPAAQAHGMDVAQLTQSLGPTGALLKAVRQLRGLSLQQLSETTRISSRYLDAVEREDFDTLPSAAAFVRGYVREMARILELDVERVVEGYMRRFRGDG